MNSKRLKGKQVISGGHLGVHPNFADFMGGHLGGPIIENSFSNTVNYILGILTQREKLQIAFLKISIAVGTLCPFP